MEMYFHDIRAKPLTCVQVRGEASSEIPCSLLRGINIIG